MAAHRRQHPVTDGADAVEAMASPGRTGPVQRFVLFQRGDSSQVACQISRILYVSTGDHGAILHFGGNSQVNVQQSFDEVLAMLKAIEE
ncbi:hypothetical protein AB433_00110 [Croceicoccus naphthovorans]|uniref:Uncharacterized protein n=1 Tax=Croceicoccus naphthovorans TaxID=1348774 RepID=A0A0G3XB44_9SPHN|nr:hypothetical protein AB433_00110 [Croceicoccus naphthovorans]